MSLRPRRLRLSPSWLLVWAVVPVVSASDASAQIRASEPATVQQTIDGTVFTIEYFRPRARGRSPLFGHDAVVWEHIWTPGANWATTFEFQKDITINGHEVPAGKYGIWIDMSEAEFMPTTLILEPDVLRFHTNPPEERDAQIRMPLTLSEGPYREVLTWEFEDISSTGGVLSLNWGEMRIPLEIGVQPSMRMTVTEEEGRPVVGMYDLVPPPGAPPMPEGMTGPTFEVTLDTDGALWADFEGMPGDEGDWFNQMEFRLLLFADGIFKPAEYYSGAVQEVWDAFLELDYEGGQVTGFSIRDGKTDEIFMSAVLRR
jgi:hypothetical protein